MDTRKYSVSEIDSMRSSVQSLLIFKSLGYTTAQIEEQLRTYMLNGTDPQELEAVVDKQRANYYSELGNKN